MSKRADDEDDDACLLKQVKQIENGFQWEFCCSLAELVEANTHTHTYAHTGNGNSTNTQAKHGRHTKMKRLDNKQTVKRERETLASSRDFAPQYF